MEAITGFFQTILQESMSIPAWGPLVMLLIIAICLLTNTHHIGMLALYILTVYLSWGFITTTFAGVGTMVFVVLAIAILILSLLQLHHVHNK